MPLAIEEAFLRRNPSKKLVIGVAIDGSNLSDSALEAACALYNEKRKDRLVILHVADSRKTFLPKNLQPKYLENQYVDKAFALHAHADWACREKGNSSTCEALMALAQENHVDLLVVGSFGRKGERVDMLGTVSDYSLREGHSSVAIIRRTAPKRANGGHLYMFATDCSRAAATAYCTLCHQLVKPGDQILLVTCSYDHQHAQAPDSFKQYEQLAVQLKIPLETVSCHLERDQCVSEGLLKLADTREVDTLVCGISGYSQKKLGSVSDEITHHATCNTIVIKDPQVLGDQAKSAGARGITNMILPQKSFTKK